MTGDTKNKTGLVTHTQAFTKSYSVAQNETNGTINTPTATHANTDTRVDAHPQLSQKWILLMQTQRPVLYTQKQQLQSINTLAHIDGHTQANTHTDAHIWRLILQLLGSTGTECPQQLWIPPNGNREGAK